MVAIFGLAILVAKMALERSSGVVHRVREPGWIAHKSFMFRAGGIGIPTTSVPGVVRFTNGLADFAGGVVARGVFLAVHHVMDTDGNIATVQIGEIGSIV